MKKSLIYLLSVVLISFLFVGCEKEESFDKALLIGKWKSGNLFYKYLSNGFGSTWVFQFAQRESQTGNHQMTEEFFLQNTKPDTVVYFSKKKFEPYSSYAGITNGRKYLLNNSIFFGYKQFRLGF